MGANREAGEFAMTNCEDELFEVRADLDRETQMRRDAERHARSLVAHVESMPFPDEWEAIIGAADALAEAVWPHQQEMQPPNGTPALRNALKAYREARKGR
jgi:hypothetical protein